MAANSPLRRIIKRVLAPFLPQGSYSYLHSLSMARDIRSGTFSEPELDLIPFAVRAGETVVDVGANFGLYTYHLSRAVGPSGKVYAFEPIPYTSATLRRVVRRLGIGNAEIVAKGCSERAGRVTFRLPLAASGAVSAGQAHIGRRDDERAGWESQVRWEKTVNVDCEVVSLDDVLPDVPEISLIKCDIEGAELLAFRGAERTFARHKPTVICEINPWFLEGFGIGLGELIGFFTDRGYGLYRYDDRGRSLRPVDDPATVDEDNYVFIHAERLERFRGLLPSADRAAGTASGRNP
jgi:FkbM family methyltransferase